MLIKQNIIFHRRYRLYDLRGQGGFGDVYWAYDLKKQRRVALKVAKTSLAREGRFLRMLHPLLPAHIPYCSAYGQDKDSDLFYLAMQYIPGQTLEETLTYGISCHQIEDIFRQLVTILQVMHQQNIIYRDLKPSNLIVTPKKHVVLIDFGIACFTDEFLSARCAGTLEYLAPEVLAHHIVTPAMDLYALGKTLQDLFQVAQAHTCITSLRNACSICLKIQTLKRFSRHLVLDLPSRLAEPKHLHQILSLL